MGAKVKRSSQKQISTALGAIIGGILGALLNYFVYSAVGPEYPISPTTFVVFAAGAFGGMAIADKLGKKSFKVMAMAAGLLFALLILALMIFTGS